jgi:hypothetical protein
MKAPTRMGESEAVARVCEKIVGEERAPLALMILALYKQAEIYARPHGGVCFTATLPMALVMLLLGDLAYMNRACPNKIK